MDEQQQEDVPSSWDDIDVLYLEPFKTEFELRYAAEESRRRKGLHDFHWESRIATRVLSRHDWRMRCRKWLEYAFSSDPELYEGYGQRAHRALFALTQENAELYVRIFWRFRQNMDEEAAIILRKARSEAGFGFALPIVTASKRKEPRFVPVLPIVHKEVPGRRDKTVHVKREDFVQEDAPIPRTRRGARGRTARMKELQQKLPLGNKKDTMQKQSSQPTGDASCSDIKKKKENATRADDANDSQAYETSTESELSSLDESFTGSPTAAEVSTKPVKGSESLATDSRAVDKLPSSLPPGKKSLAHLNFKKKVKTEPETNESLLRTGNANPLAAGQPLASGSVWSRPPTEIHPPSLQSIRSQQGYGGAPFGDPGMEQQDLLPGETADDYDYRNIPSPPPEDPDHSEWHGFMGPDEPDDSPEYRTQRNVGSLSDWEEGCASEPDSDSGDENEFYDQLADNPLLWAEVTNDAPKRKRPSTYVKRGVKEPAPELERPTTPEHAFVSVVHKEDLPKGCKPRIWASSRQALCESFQYFRSFQSGVYTSDGVAKGYLLSAFSSHRDTYQKRGKFIISHGGGGSRVFRAGPLQDLMIVADDQIEEEGSTRALLQTYKRQTPIVLIIDDKYVWFPYDLNEHTYAVLGFYWIVDAWAEREPANNERGFCTKFKFAFQWCESQGRPWWFPKQAGEEKMFSKICVKEEELVTKADIVRRLTTLEIRGCKPRPVTGETLMPKKIRETRTCGKCLEESPCIFDKMWACLHPTCDAFWMLGGTRTFLPQDLDYDPLFFVLRKEPPQFIKNWDLKLVEIDPIPKNRNNTTRDCARGWWCRQCGRLNSREKWEYWECGRCGLTHAIYGAVRGPKEFWPQRRRLKFGNHVIHPESGIRMSKGRWWEVDLKSGSGVGTEADARERCQGTVFSYELPEGYGVIHVLHGTPVVNERADELFKLYQEEAQAGGFFKRHPLQTHPLRGPLLANHFSHNAGAPYKYVAGGETVPFERAPKSVLGALELIKRRAASVLGGEEIEFNEVLSAAYMEKQKMSFHTDSEPGLGPVVSSLSLGSTALMHFRLHRSQVGPEDKRPRMLSLVLNHGDILIMDGYYIQTIYEHTVVPKNFRIAATARCIKPEEYHFYA